MFICCSREQLISLHEVEPGFFGPAVMEHRSSREYGNEELVERAIALLGDDAFCHLREQPKEQRSRAIGILRASGLSIRQVERATGIGRGIISRVRCDRMT